MVKKQGERGGAGKKGGVVVKRGAWTPGEDQKLMDYIRAHGDKKWRLLPAKAGLNRSGKSCRLRWLNYLRPGIKRGSMTEEEEDLIIRLHSLLGNRWSLIAGRLPGRTDNEIKNHWNTHLRKRSLTIKDLNFKLKLKLKQDQLEGGNGAIPPTIPPEPNLAYRDLASAPRDVAELAIFSPELSVSDFDVKQLYDFMWMPGLYNHDAGVASSASELGVEDYGITADDC